MPVFCQKQPYTRRLYPSMIFSIGKSGYRFSRFKSYMRPAYRLLIYGALSAKMMASVGGNARFREMRARIAES
jgi:hypothetical protein